MNLSGILATCASATAALAITVNHGDSLGFPHGSAPRTASLPAPPLEPASWTGPRANLAAAAAVGPEISGPVLLAPPTPVLPGDAITRIIGRARQDVTNHIKYDATYQMLPAYPNGDIPQDRGACTDTVIRAFRSVGVDLQVLVHDDILAAPEAYGTKPDPNVDHRRVGTLLQYLERNALVLSNDVRHDRATFEAGDIVFFAWKRCRPKYPCVAEHVGLVSDRIGKRGLPLVLQNGGPTATESDGLDHGTLVGHYRFNHVFHKAQKTAP